MSSAELEEAKRLAEEAIKDDARDAAIEDRDRKGLPAPLYLRSEEIERARTRRIREPALARAFLALAAERDELQDALRHAVHRNHISSGCDGCLAIARALNKEKEETK